MAQSPSIQAQPAFGGRKALIGALILGAIAAILIVAFLASRESGTTVASVGAPVTIVIAKDNIEAGTKITGAMVERRDVPRELLVAGSFTDLTSVVGQTARYPIARGEQMSPARLVEANTTVKSLSFQIPPGLRGFTVPVDIKTSPSALIAPGDFVDIIVSAELTRLSPIAGTSTQTLTNDKIPNAVVTLLQNVQVLSVDRKYADNGVVYDSSTRGTPPGKDDDVNFVTLAVTPEQAQVLWLASQQGKITLTLRAFGDNKVADVAPMAEPIRIK